MDNPYLTAYRQQQQQKQTAPVQTAAPPPQQSTSPLGGIMGFLKNAGQSLGSTYTHLGQGLANVANEVTGGAQAERDQQQQSQQNDVNTIKSLGQKLKTTTNPQDQQRIRDAISKISNIGNQQANDIQTHQNQIIEQNNPIKGAADVASVGLDVLGAGAGSNILKGGLRQAIGQGVKQGAVFGGAQGALEPVKQKGATATAEDIGGNAATGAGMGALTGGVVGAASGLISKILPHQTLPSVPKVDTSINDARSLAENLKIRSALDSLPNSSPLGATALRGDARSSIDTLNNIGRKSIFGKNITATANKSDIIDTSNQADQAEMFNRLAQENIHRLANKAQNAGVPIESGGETSGMLVRPTANPSFASEGVEYKGIPNIPELNSRYKSFDKFSPSNYPNIPARDSENVTRLTANSLEQPTGKTMAIQNGKPSSLLRRAGQATADKGTQMKARAGGYGIGEKQGGQSLGFFDSANIDQNLANEGIKAGTPSSRLKAVENSLDQRGKQLDQAVTENNLPITQADKHQIAAQYMSELENTPGVTNTAKKYAQQHVDTFLKSGDNTKGLISFKRGLDKNVINYNANPDAATSANQLAGTVFRNTLKDAINERVPGVQDLNNSFHNLSEAAGFLKGGSKAISDQSQSAGGGVIGRALTNETAQGVKSHVGSLLQKAGAPTAETKNFSMTPKDLTGKVDQKALDTAFKTPQALQGTGKELFSSLITPTVARDAATMQPDQQNTAQPAQDGTPIVPDSSTSDISSAPDTSSNADSLFNKDNIQNLVLQDLTKNGGKNVGTLLSLYKTLGDTSAQQKPLSAQSSQVIGNANSGLASLKQLGDIINQQGGVSKSTLVPGRDLFGGLGANTLGTASYDTASKNIQDVITRLRSGAAITPEEAQFYNSQLPSAFDKPDVINQKLSMFRDLFTSVANRTGASNVDTQSLIGQ